MSYFYSIIASITVGIHLFTLKLLSKFKSRFNEIFILMIITLILSRLLIYYAMSTVENPTNVHIILSLSVFVTFFASMYFFKLNNFDVISYIIGVLLIISGLYFINHSYS